ncbi:MAG: energy transducer TonB [Bacteroidales bacterium]
MKTKLITSKAETLEDIVFEGRNKAYGAYELNRKNRKYLVLAFLISVTGISSAVAIPFINAIRKPVAQTLTRGVTEVILTDAPVNTDLEPPPPPPPPDMTAIERQVVYLVPVVVEQADTMIGLIANVDIGEMLINAPPPVNIPVAPVPDAGTGIEEPGEEPMVCPQEGALFMNGGLEEFQKWVVKNITYPPEAIENKIFGKVILEFCVNKKGEVVDVKFLRKLHPSVDEETFRVINSSPRWKPAKQGGTPVKQRFTIPFSFEMI